MDLTLRADTAAAKVLAKWQARGPLTSHQVFQEHERTPDTSNIRARTSQVLESMSSKNFSAAACSEADPDSSLNAIRRWAIASLHASVHELTELGRRHFGRCIKTFGK